MLCLLVKVQIWVLYGLGSCFRVLVQVFSLVSSSFGIELGLRLSLDLGSCSGSGSGQGTAVDLVLGFSLSSGRGSDMTLLQRKLNPTKTKIFGFLF